MPYLDDAAITAHKRRYPSFDDVRFREWMNADKRRWYVFRRSSVADANRARQFAEKMERLARNDL